jgi:dienelactone hydrolase
MAWLPSASTKETVQQRIDALMITSTLVMPEGVGPFPVVIQMHGCGGRKPFQDDWARVAKDAGWAVLVVDSYAHRKISSLEAYATVCTGLQLWGRERAGDMYAMMEWLRDQTWADSARIAVAGWSHGGWTALDGMALTPGTEAASATRLTDLAQEPLTGLVGAFVVYPFAGPGALAPARGLRVDAPVCALVGANDVIVGGRGLAGTLKRMSTKGAPVEVVMLEGATHAFDEPSARDLRVRYDPELTARAHGYYSDFLKAAAKAQSKVR